MGYANQPIIACQDIFRITVEDEDNQWVTGELEHLVSDRKFNQIYVYLELSLKDIIPLRTVLAQNYPNPFNPETWILYQLSKSVTDKIEIYDAKVKIVHTLDLGIQSTRIYFNQTMLPTGMVPIQQENK